MITFAPRESVFDIGNERSGSNEFRVRHKAHTTNLIMTDSIAGLFHAILDINVSPSRPKLLAFNANARLPNEDGIC